MLAPGVFVCLFVPVLSYIASGSGASVDEQLATKRKQIDDIDRQIVALINRRASVVDEIGQIKSGAGVPVSAPHREEQVLKHVAEMGGSGPFPVARIQSIYSTLLAQMREWEEERHASRK